ncbi:MULTISPECIES: GDP-mannose 4,6-dehydratase [unclassified Rhizobium]|uniref:GDP-mannose 4,6-dehydratase n=1 Tax=unclassified Rhizobium TaxID=2613769 RepID=UPI001160D1F9|nr:MULTISPECIES: GDP-mannose 4,6-dehydratase [unclassified Rhizobium]TQX86911.1 NAD-dependent epimerase/dehydratase family protein [Rhizobium sp. rho-13.1]TQY08690.1 NAD-dependent epimerase/dehydratase family protein [Rhizobium sp. rho-1.1]
MSTQHRILVTGASGFVGTWLTRVLLDFSADANLALVTAGRGSGCDINLDVTHNSSVVSVLRDFRPTAVVHLAAITAPQEARKNPTEAWNVNFHGTINLASAVLSEVPECRFVFAGSSEAYGQAFADSALVTENNALKPMTVYGATKAAADIALGQMHFDGLRSIRFRPFNHTGPGQAETFVVPAFASQIARIEIGLKPPVIEVGNLAAHRDFLDVRDVVNAYALAALGKGRNVEGKVFNLASGKTVEIRTILEILVRLSGLNIEVVASPDRVRPIEIEMARGDASAALKCFGWMPQINLEETIQAVLSDWRERVNAQ